MFSQEDNSSTTVASHTGDLDSLKAQTIVPEQDAVRDESSRNEQPDSDDVERGRVVGNMTEKPQDPNLVRSDFLTAQVVN